MLKIATVCSGIGSPEMALAELSKELGFDFENVFACEIDKYARASYNAIHSTGKMYEDMTTELWDEPEQYSDLFIGGIPCQAFSLAGKRLGELDPRGLLFFDFYRYVKNQQPKVFIIENVKGLLSDNKGKTFQNWLLLLGNSVNGHSQMFNHPDSLGYNLHHTVLNSKNFGVPQNRERVFIVGVRSDLPNDFRFPIGWKLDKRLKDVLEIDVDEKYYLSDKMVQGFVSKGNAGFINQDTQASPVYNIENLMPTISERTHGYANDYVPETTNLQGKKYVNTIRTGGRGSLTDKHNWDMVIEPIEPLVIEFGRSEEEKKRKSEHFKKFRRDSGSFKDKTLILKKQPDYDTLLANPNFQKEGLICEPYFIQGGLQEHQKQRFDGICPTLTSAMGMGGGQTPVHNVNSRIRRLTPLECWRLQGFTDEDFHKAKSVNSDTQLYKQAGNSITKKVIKSITKNLLNVLCDQEVLC